MLQSYFRLFCACAAFFCVAVLLMIAYHFNLNRNQGKEYCSQYDRGCTGNVQQVFGPTPLYWYILPSFLPPPPSVPPPVVAWPSAPLTFPNHHSLQQSEQQQQRQQQQYLHDNSSINSNNNRSEISAQVVPYPADRNCNRRNVWCILLQSWVWLQQRSCVCLLKRSRTYLEWWFPHRIKTADFLRLCVCDLWILFLFTIFCGIEWWNNIK